MENLQEDIYSSQTRKFIRIAEKIESREFHYIPIMDLATKARLIYRYLEENFQYLGGGAHRHTFISDKKEVIKVVQPDSDERLVNSINQNKEEIKIFKRHDVAVFPRVEEASKLGIWFIVEKVIPLDSLGSEEAMKTKLEEMFPKFFNMVREYFGEYVVRENTIGGLTWILSRFLKFKFAPDRIKKVEPTDSYSTSGDIYKLLRMIKGDLGVSSASGFGADDDYTIDKGWAKPRINAIMNYLDNPDRNFKLTVHAFKATNMDPGDFHDGNFGFDDKGDLKILDVPVGEEL